MASRKSLARPKKEGEDFARTHHHDRTDDTDPKRVKFDVRNPSKLAADAREADAVLDADVIGSGGGGVGGTKRGAVNLDGYDSDSDAEDFKSKSKKGEEVDIMKQLDNYDKSLQEEGPTEQQDDDDDDDMFAADGDENHVVEPDEHDKSGKKKKEVRFMDTKDVDGEEGHVPDVVGQVLGSTSGGTVRLDDEESTDDEEEADLRRQEQAVDEEVGAGGLKKNAPKVEAFNLRAEMEDGRFDQEGNFIRKAGDPDAAHDNWLEGVSKKDMKKAAEAHEKRESEAREKRVQEDALRVSDLLSHLIVQLERAETPLEALARLGKSKAKPKKQVPKWKLKKTNKGEDDADRDKEDDLEQVQIKNRIEAITDAADKLLGRDFEEIYDQERELLIRSYQRETGEEWIEPTRPEGEESEESAEQTKSDQTWEFRWVDGRDEGNVQGPFKLSAMKAWQDAGYFQNGVEFRLAGGADDTWTKSPNFA